MTRNVRTTRTMTTMTTIRALGLDGGAKKAPLIRYLPLLVWSVGAHCVGVGAHEGGQHHGGRGGGEMAYGSTVLAPSPLLMVCPALHAVQQGQGICDNNNNDGLGLGLGKQDDNKDDDHDGSKRALLWSTPSMSQEQPQQKDLLDDESRSSSTRIKENNTAPQDPSSAAAAAAAAAPRGHDDEDLFERVDVDERGWITGTNCQAIPWGPQQGQLFCAYTQPSFHNGFGISIVTTPATFETILHQSLPVLNHHNNKNNNSSSSSSSSSLPYQTVPVPGKGLGMRATRAIHTHEVYMARTPALMVDDVAVAQLGVSRLRTLLVAAVDALPRAHRDQVLRLTTHDDMADDDETRDQRVYAIFDKNNFLTNWEGVGGFHSTFTHVSRLNHACRANSDYVFDSTTLSHNIFAARDIDAGEELTLTYHDPFQTHAHRQSSLLHNWGFKCKCALCTAPAASIAQSDERITQIQHLWSLLDHYHPSSSDSADPNNPTTATATPADAERLIQLYRDEGLWTRLVEAYYRAAVEYNGRGDEARAVQFAQRAIEAGRVMESGIRPFLDNMRALARDPRGHWTWMFRVPK